MTIIGGICSFQLKKMRSLCLPILALHKANMVVVLPQLPFQAMPEELFNILLFQLLLTNV